jgi:hypothetical protein
MPLTNLLPDPDSRGRLAEVLVVGGLTAIGLVTNPSSLVSVATTLAGAIGGNWAASFSESAFHRWRESWFKDRGVLNHDLANALRHSFKGAVSQLEQDWKRGPRYNHLKRTDAEAARLTLMPLQHLREDVEAIFKKRDRLVSVLAQQGQLAGNEMEVRQGFNDTLRRYLFGHDAELVGFVERRLADEWTLRFYEFLKDPGDAGTRAWRAYQRLWQTSLAGTLQAVQQDTAEIRKLAEELTAWKDRLDTLPVTQRDPTGEEVLEQALGEIKHRLDRLIETAKHIKSDVGQVKTDVGHLREGMETLLERVQAAPTDEEKLEAAVQLLDALPLDILPESTTLLLGGSRIAFSRNDLFVGRQEELKTLAAILKERGAATGGQTAAITGIGGKGKTQLAAEFVYRYGQFFAGGVFWLSFAEPDAIPAEIAACGGPDGLNLPAFSALPLEDQVRRVQGEWQSPLPCLLVFDNCEEEKLLVRWRPKAGGCRVLLTSRREQWEKAQGVQALALGDLERPESVALLRSHRDDLSEDDPNLNAIADELGDLPLALHLAGSYTLRGHR